ncbi:MAG: hypothetical protein HZC37_26475 [Burkholderiales bacterium]|nr:hypothetical protein [Burkholderiales bacterium]
MSRLSTIQRLPQPTRRQLLLGAASLGASSLLAACGGGGGDSTDAGTSTAASYTSGPISGFGSVIVGGVRFDDTLALIVDEDGNLSTRGDLKLGCVIDIDAGHINRAEARAVALRIMLGGALVGPVSAVDGTSNTMMLLGQTVLVTTSTVFDAAITGGIGGITVGGVYEVHGLFDRANSRFVATRIAPKAGATEYRLRGVISELDTTARTFKIGSELVNYAGVPNADVPSTLANGQFVRVLLQTTQVNGAWVAIRLRHSVRTFEPRPEAHVEGVITVFTSAQSFEINGLQVDASNAAFPDGTTGIVLGARVEVEGAIVGGVLVATKVEIEDRRDFGRRLLEFRGEMGNLDTTAKTFALRGLTIWYGGTVEYRNGTEATLADGKIVEVKGVISVDRTRIEARRIEFK